MVYATDRGGTFGESLRHIKEIAADSLLSHDPVKLAVKAEKMTALSYLEHADRLSCAG